MAEPGICRRQSCGARVDDGAAACPRCGGPVVPFVQLRQRSMVLVGAGLFLLIFAGGTVALSLRMIARSEHPGDPQNSILFAALGVVFAFGLAAAAGGAWQLATGRWARRLPIVLLFLLALLTLGFWVAQLAYGDGTPRWFPRRF